MKSFVSTVWERLAALHFILSDDWGLSALKPKRLPVVSLQSVTFVLYSCFVFNAEVEMGKFETHFRHWLSPTLEEISNLVSKLQIYSAAAASSALIFAINKMLSKKSSSALLTAQTTCWTLSQQRSRTSGLDTYAGRHTQTHTHNIHMSI